MKPGRCPIGMEAICLPTVNDYPVVETFIINMKKHLITRLLAMLAGMPLCSQAVTQSLPAASSQVIPLGQDSSFKMISRSQWELTQVPSTAKETGRLKTSLQVADYEPVGLRATANTPLVLNVTQISGTGLPKLIVGTYDRQTVSTYTLTAGVNTITNVNGGDLYLQYAADNPSEANKVQVTFQSGYQEMPFYILGATTHNDWLNMLAADTLSPNATLVANRVFIVVSRVKATEYKNENQDTLLQLIDQVMQAEGDISGLDNSTPVHAPFLKNKLMLLEKASGNPDATSLGRVRIPTGNINWILSPSYILNSGGWGVFHEIGHHHQHYSWTWSTCIEVCVNIYSLAAKRAIHPNDPGIGASDWNNIFTYLAQPSASKNFNASSTALFVRLGMFHQLWLAYGDSFYHTLHKRSRDEAPSPSGDEAEMRGFMIYACQISGENLGNFFKTWGLNVSPSIYAELDALGLPAPAVDPSLLRDDVATAITMPASNTVYAAGDTILINATAFGPRKVTKVAFFQGSTKLSEDTTAPYSFAWNNAAPGSYTLTTKATIAGGQSAVSAPVNITLNAISLTAPADYSAFAAGVAIPFTANVAVINSPVQLVEFYADSIKIGTSATAPYGFNWAHPTAGTHSLLAKVIYQDGTVAFSASSGIVVGGTFPIADSYVRDGGTANTNYGRDLSLVVKKDGNSGFSRTTYLKLDVKDLANIDTARLRMNIAGAGATIGGTQWQIWKCEDDSWTETGITWNNKPATTTLLASQPGKKTGYVEWDITGPVLQELAGDKTLTLAVVSSVSGQSNDATFSSREVTDVKTRPVLLIDIVDTIAPLLTVPADTTIDYNTSAAPAITGYAAATDNSGIPAEVIYADSSLQDADTTKAAHYNYLILRRWTATDRAGNQNIAVQNVTVQYQKSVFNTVSLFAGTTNNGVNGRRADLRAELILNGTSVASGTLLNQQLNGNSLSSSQLFRIPLSGSPVVYTPADLLQLKVSARRAGGNGTFGVKIWYNTDSLDATSKGYSQLPKYAAAGSEKTMLFLGGQYLLQANAGNAPASVELKVDNSFREVATWSTIQQSDTCIAATYHDAPLQARLLSAVAYPNPSNGDFTLTVTNSSNKEIQVFVLDFFGREIKQLKFPAGQPARFGNDLNRGVYFVIIKQDVREAFVKLVKQ